MSDAGLSVLPKQLEPVNVYHIEAKLLDQRLYAISRELRDARDHWEMKSDRCEAAVSQARAYLEECASEYRCLLDTAGQLATRSEIAKAVALLCAVFPSADRTDLSGFARIACEDVGQMRPSRYALHTALKELRRSSKWLPAISEILPELRKHEDRLAGRRNAFTSLPKLIEQVEARRDEIIRKRKAHALRSAPLPKNDTPA